MKNLFIDTNIWLSLYHFSNDNLNEFKKLEGHIGKDINLIITKQVMDEFSRNRENKLDDMFKGFSLNKVNFPAFSEGYPEYNNIKEDFDKFNKNFKDWNDKIEENIRSFSLPADSVVKRLFHKATVIDSDEYYELAVRRKQKGNPPGKDERIGDELNWESLLDNVNMNEDLYLISSDKDYRSCLFDNDINPFLRNEWEVKKKSKIFFYKSLTQFLNENLADVDINEENDAEEIEKELLINRLSNSSSFIDTHNIISQMTQYNNWSKQQVERLKQILKLNPQVFWIYSDNDVKNFFDKL